jgi:Tfp pilus assembly protein PilN
MKIGINLLPPNKKEEIRLIERFRTVLVWEAVIFSIALIFFGFIFGIDYVLSLNLQMVSGSQRDESTGAKYETIKYYESKFSQINVKIGKISGITTDQIYWSKLFVKLNEVTPASVELSGLSTKDYAVFLAGRAKTRDDLILFRDNLAQEDCFQNVNLPLSDLVSKEDIVFQIDLEIKESCVKNK